MRTPQILDDWPEDLRHHLEQLPEDITNTLARSVINDEHSVPKQMQPLLALPVLEKHPRLLRGRFASEIYSASSRRPRSNVFEIKRTKPDLTRSKSMPNLGATLDMARASDLLPRGLDDIRQTLIVKEENKPAVAYVRC
jgi:hypothetical protein